MVTYADFAPMVPELFLLGVTCLLLLLDLFISAQRRGMVHFLAILALIATAILGARSHLGPGEAASAFSGMFVRDTMGDVLKLVVYLVSAAALVYAKPYLSERGLFKGEYHVLVLFAVLGMMLLISAGSLLMVYLGLELLALSSYALVALDRDSRVASEAAMKYFVLGALASGMLLYGISLVYGATGSLDLARIHVAAAATGDHTLLLTGVVFMLVGISFKFGAAPFHMWLPDVYQGAPTAVTLFIGSAPKLAAFAMAYRLLESGVGPLDGFWRDLVAWIAVASLVLGNLIAIAQTNLKRMLAYSTISHVGFLFLGLSAGNAEGYAAAMFYAISYALMSAAAFATIIALSRRGFEAEEIADFRGLNSRNPWLAWLVLAVMASLAGIPFFLGFWAKLAVLRAAIDGGMLWLALTGLVFAVVGAYYYLRVIKTMFFDEPVDRGDEHGQAGGDDPQLRWLLSVNAGLLLVLGLGWNGLMQWCQQSFLG